MSSITSVFLSGSDAYPDAVDAVRHAAAYPRHTVILRLIIITDTADGPEQIVHWVCRECTPYPVA